MKVFIYHYRRWVPFTVGLVYALVLHLALGMDALWDTANYHMYIGWAAWRGLGYTAGAVAQYHTYLNPVLDMVNYGLFSWHTLAGAAWQALVLAGVMALVYRLAQAVMPAGLKGRRAELVAAGAVALGATGAMTVSLFGSWTNEHQIALLMLGTLYLVVMPGRSGWRRYAVAGILAGVALGLKLTALPYVLGLLVAALVMNWGRVKWRWWICLAVGIVLGFGLTDGLFMIWRWQATGNPLYPFAGGLFGGQAAAWQPATPFDWRQVGSYIVLPVTWLYRGDTSEAGPLRDPRMLLIYAGLAGAGWVAWRRRLRRVELAVVMFAGTSWLWWLLGFRIYRYLVTLELLVGVVVLIGLGPWLTKWPERKLLAGALVAVVSLGLLTVYPDWGRRPWQATFEKSNIAEVVKEQGGGMVLYAGPHLTYLSRELAAAGIPYTNALAQGWWDGERADNPVDVHEVAVAPPAKVLFIQSKKTDIRDYSPYLKSLYPDQFYYCLQASSNMKWQPLVCAFRTAEQMPSLTLGQSYRFDARELVFGEGWGNAEPEYRWSAAKSSRLWLQVANVSEGCRLEGRIEGQTLGKQDMKLRINGAEAGQLETDGNLVWSFMVPGEATDSRRELAMELHFPDAAVPGPQDRRELALALNTIEFECQAEAEVTP